MSRDDFLPEKKEGQIRGGSSRQGARGQARAAVDKHRQRGTDSRKPVDVGGGPKGARGNNKIRWGRKSVWRRDGGGGGGSRGFFYYQRVDNGDGDSLDGSSRVKLHKIGSLLATFGMAKREVNVGRQSRHFQTRTDDTGTGEGDQAG